MPFIGSHLSLSNYSYYDNPYITLFKKIRKYGGNTVELMININNKHLFQPNIIINTKKYIKKHNLLLIIHASYIYNIAQDWNEYSPWIYALCKEIKYAYKLGAFCIVLHFGKHKMIDISVAYNNMYMVLLYIHNKTIKYKSLYILLETSSGQGSEMCYSMDQLIHFYNKLQKSNLSIKNRIFLCIDTCHIFAAGVDITSKKKISEYFKYLDKYIGINNIKLIHLNDSKNVLGSKKDRHEILGKGYIGKVNLLYFAKLALKFNIPILLETPNNAYKYELPLLIDSLL